MKERIFTIVVMCLAATTLFSQNVNESKAQSLLNLRNQMEQASDVKQKKEIIKAYAQTGEFLAMTEAARYLDDVELAKTAAQTVVAIAMNHPEYDGYNTRQMLAKAAPYVGKGDRKAIMERMAKTPVEGFVSHFNGKDLTGWKGLVENPIAREKMTPVELAAKQVEADQRMREDWVVENGLLAYVGHGYDNICTQELYGDFEMYVDWKLDPKGAEPDAGIYLRGTPQVQIWDIARVNVGAQVGSGGLYNNQKNKAIPLCVADNKLGEWNSFFIRMKGDRVTVYLNGILVVDDVVLENYWDRSRPIFPVEQIELQAHGSKVYYRDIYIKRLGACCK